LADSLAGKKLVLLDAMSLVFRAFYAPMQMALVSPAGLPTKAVYIFVRTLRKILKDHRPDYVGVAFDLAAPTFRDKLFEEYKANRPPFPEELGVQMPYVRRFCQALGMPVVEKEGFEADDVIGTLAAQGASHGMDVEIVSGDEDLFQLVNERIKVVKPGRAGSDGATVCDAAKVKEIIGVEPAQVVDWLALTGDPSDNIPGTRPLPGQEPPRAEGEKKRSYIGPKGATELIQKFDTLENVLANYEQVSRVSYRDALRDYPKEARLSRELATIHTNVPLPKRLGDLRPSGLEIDQATALCQELGFATLLRELLQESPAPAAAAVAQREITSPADLKQWLADAWDGNRPVAVGFWVEGGEGFTGRLASLGFLAGGDPVTVQASTNLLAATRTFFADAKVAKSVHNSKLLEIQLAKAGISLCGVAEDTLLYSYLLDPLASSQDLEHVALRTLGRKPADFAADAASATAELADHFRPDIARENLGRVYREIELPLSPVLAQIEATGIRIDPALLASMSGEFDRELVALTQEIHTIAGEAFDVDSPKQLGEILFEKLKLPGGKRLRKSGQWSTDASVLEALAERHELPRKILAYRTRAKLKSTYIDALPRFITPETGRIHTSFNQAGSRTGRFSSSNPNLQNIPIGDEFGLRIRSAFVAEPGWKLISADYSQVELRVLAHLAHDVVLVEAFQRGEDIHARTAQEIFGIPAGLQTHEHRRMAKAINYGVVYGLSSFGLSGRTGTSKTEAQKYIDAYFERYRGVKEFLDRQVEEARTTGRVHTLFGRLRPIPEIQAGDPAARNRAEREAMNTPVQGTAADLMKLAMVKTQARLGKEKVRTRMVLTVHDELVFEAPESEIAQASELVKAEMENAYPLEVPLKVDLGTGANWKEAK
jgi:DNA polymerase I